MQQSGTDSKFLHQKLGLTFLLQQTNHQVVEKSEEDTELKFLLLALLRLKLSLPLGNDLRVFKQGVDTHECGHPELLAVFKGRLDQVEERGLLVNLSESTFIELGFFAFKGPQ